jgi:hypothetical protein
MHDILLSSREKHLEEFRMETEYLTARYAKLLEDKKRLEQDME